MTEDEPVRWMRLIDNPSVAGPVTGEGTGYITIEHATTEDVTRIPEAFEPCPPLHNGLTDTQLKTFDWALTCLIEQTEERAHGLQPDQAVEEICGLASLVELLPMGELHCRLAAHCEAIRREHQVRLDAVLAAEAAAAPKIIVTGEVNGSSEGHEVADLDAAAAWAADWIKGIDPADTGVDFRISIELQGPEAP